MVNNRYSFLWAVIFIILTGCKSDEKIEAKKTVNYFSFKVNDQLWVPSVLSDDECTSTYMCNWSAIDNQPFYTISAHRDPNGKASYTSENFLTIEIMNVNGRGTYELTGNYKSKFTSHALFVINNSEGNLRYVNNPKRNPFVVQIDEMVATQSSKPGIKGSFHGVLYQENNPMDSLIIKEGSFSFRIINFYNFNHCEQ